MDCFDYTFDDYDKAREKYGKKVRYDELYGDTLTLALRQMEQGGRWCVNGGNSGKDITMAKMAYKYTTDKQKRTMFNGTKSVNDTYIHKHEDTLKRLRAKLEAKKSKN